MHADAEVMADLGGPFTRVASDTKFDRYRAALSAHGISRWAIKDGDGVFQGYAGVMFRPERAHPLGPHHEIGWRLRRSAWGKGCATEAARAALADAFRVTGLARIFSYTSADNLRSQGVMRKLGLVRDAASDFSFAYEGDRPWAGLVWVAERETGGSA